MGASDVYGCTCRLAERQEQARALDARVGALGHLVGLFAMQAELARRISAALAEVTHG
jgi:hypothetical protein